MIITTADSKHMSLEEDALQIAHTLNIEYVKRNKQSIKKIHSQYNSDILVVAKHTIIAYDHAQLSPLTFHPNFAQVRAKRILNGEDDAFVDACNINEHSTVLDCTLGMSQDSIIASLVAKNGTVTGLEVHPLIYAVNKFGLKRYNSNIASMNIAMRNIKVVHTNYEVFLKCAKSKSYDIVYLDPMFDTTLPSSDGIQPLKHYALHTFNTKILEEATRVAKQRVVLKAHFKSNYFTKEMQKTHSQNRKFQYGIINLQE